MDQKRLEKSEILGFQNIGLKRQILDMQMRQIRVELSRVEAEEKVLISEVCGRLSIDNFEDYFVNLEEGVVLPRPKSAVPPVPAPTVPAPN